ncbi:RrF2 family transcriptional regulator [Priestia koreensis]|uniref:Transcriptional regulator n=1 Tax=Priestia koreensis TaxID=284581 RepID=A0A0M0LAA1_9BACI|nr:Rrf2 family transcriptional regulator [Priestia koreensis]KOO47568.1 transcriptional regulator [Priestia koreensis]MCM3006174.1 Rrf2 family transcriptional regulator [Priestia koreensis]
MQMKTGVEQSVYALLILNFLPPKAVLPGEVISELLGASPSYFQKLLRKLVSADLIVSVPGAKGGFKLKKQPDDIQIYDVYVAIEGKQSLYSSSGILQDMLNLEEKKVRLLSNLMEEAETSWKTTLKRESIGSLAAEIDKKCPPESLTRIQGIVQDRMVL